MLLTNLARLRGRLFLAALASAYEALGHRWRGGELSCPHPRYSVVVELVVRGRRAGSLRVRTCPSCDLGS